MIDRFYSVIVVAIFLIFSGVINSQQKPSDDEIKKGIDYIYNIKFDSAEFHFKDIITRYPYDPSGRFFLAMIEWWKIALDFNDESRDGRFLAMLEDVIFHCDRILKQNPEDKHAIFYKGGALGFRGRLHAIRESWLKAAEAGRLALPLVQLAHKLDPQDDDVYLGLGIYNYYADVVPQRVPLLKPLMIFFPKGDKALGIKQLEQAAYRGKFAATETKFFLMMIYYDVESDYNKSLIYANELREKYPDNPTFHKYVGRNYIRLGDYFNASVVFRQIYDKAEKGYSGYNNYLKREAMYYIGMYNRYYGYLDSAITAFSKSLEISKTIDTPGDESGFQAMAALNLGIVYDLLKQREKAVAMYNFVLSIKQYSASHVQARQYLEKPYGE